MSIKYSRQTLFAVSAASPDQHTTIFNNSTCSIACNRVHGITHSRKCTKCALPACSKPQSHAATMTWHHSNYLLHVSPCTHTRTTRTRQTQQEACDSANSSQALSSKPKRGKSPKLWADATRHVKVVNSCFAAVPAVPHCTSRAAALMYRTARQDDARNGVSTLEKGQCRGGQEGKPWTSKGHRQRSVTGNGTENLAF